MQPIRIGIIGDFEPGLSVALSDERSSLRCGHETEGSTRVALAADSVARRSQCGEDAAAFGWPSRFAGESL